MKLTPFLFAALLLAGGFLSGCTGNPREGGIFWSEDKARQRIANRQDRLNDVEDDNARVHRSNRRLEGAAARREATLGY